MLSTINTWLNHFEEGVTAFLFSLAVVLGFLEVVMRYVFGSSLGSMELVTFSLIAASLIGAAAGVRHGVHIHVEILVDRLPKSISRPVTLFGLLLCAAFTALMCFWGIQLVLFVMDLKQTTPEMRVPMWPFYTVVPISTGLMTIRFLQEFYYFKSRRMEQLPIEVYGEDVEGRPMV